jgi:hypothetical protein
MGRFSPAAGSFSRRGNWRKRSLWSDFLFDIMLLFTTVFTALTRAGLPEKREVSFFRHARVGGHPGFLTVFWIPAFAGMTAMASRSMRTGFGSFF